MGWCGMGEDGDGGGGFVGWCGMVEDGDGGVSKKTKFDRKITYKNLYKME